MGNRMEQQQPSSFPYLFLLLCFLVKLCTASDTITANQSITDGETLVSSEGNFTVGFFSPGTSQKRYVGIWFTKVSIQTVVWVANRENPITGSSGVLKIGSDGNLVVLNRTNSVIWSSNVSSVANNSTAQISDSGNLVLSYGSSVVWQSFDNPCDTALPGMIISSNLTGGANISLSSWSDSDDPSRGSFDLRVDPRDYRQIFVWKNSSRYWRSGQWDGQIFTGVPEMTNVYQNGIYLVGQTYEYLSNTNAFSRFVMNSTGAVQEFIWNEEINEWTTRWSQPTQSCQFYNYCGSNGYCSNTSSPVCACFPGFEVVSSKDWVLGNWSSGCYRSTQFQCQKNISSLSNGVGNGFWKLTEVKLPDSSGLLTGVQDINICESECTKNCSCIAFAFVNGIGCMVWDGDLMDIQQFSEDGQDLYIRLADSDLEKLKSGSNKTRLAVIISVSCIGGMVLLGACAYFLWKVKLKQKGYWKKGIVSEQSVLNSDTTIKSAKYFSDENNQGDGINFGKCPDLPLFDLSTLEASTDNFCKANKLGEGGFGPVYKGTLPGGTEIAIKRLSRSSGQGLEEFKNEVRLISKLQHRNLVRLLGCCAEGDEKMLIYEYMPNKSLDAFIFDPKKRAQLDWRKRHHIIEGIARGLLYLHRDSRLRIIHRDLKAGNILLDSEMNPKISDFGMARIFGGNQIQENTNRVVGTYGYMSPEYAMEGLFSEKSDVFSFGVLLLEIVSGKKNNAFCDIENSSNLLGFSRRLWNEDKGLDLMDPLLQDSHSTREVLRCIHVGLLCTQDAAVDRPSMPFVVAMLGTEDAYLPMPTQLEFSAENNPIEINSSRNSRAVPDMSDLTITAIEGR